MKTLRLISSTAVAIGLVVLGAPGVAAATLPPPPRTVPLAIAMTSTYRPGTTSGAQRFLTGAETVDDTDTDDVLTGLHVYLPGFSLSLTPVDGQRLHAGTYRTDGLGDPTLPQLRINVGDRDDLDSTASDVNIVDLAADAYTHIVRLDLLFRLGDNHPGYSYFGEIRLGEPDPAGQVLSNHAISWPMSRVGVAPVLATEWLQNTSKTPLAVGRPSIGGANAGDYSLNGDNCPAALSPGSYCTIRVGFSPHVAGSSAATLYWPAGGHTNQVNLRGTAPDGYSEISSSGVNAVDGTSPQQVVDGKYVQLYAAQGVRSMLFRTETTPAYDGTPYDAPWAFRITWPDITKRPEVGTYKTDPGEEALGSFWVSLLGPRGGCYSLPGTLDIRQLVYNSDGTVARADMNFTGTCDPGVPNFPGTIDTGPLTAHVRYRSTITRPQYVNPEPGKVTVGTVVPITGVTTPGATVPIFFRRRTTGTFLQLRTLKADAAGRFTSSYKAMDDYVYYARLGGSYQPVQYLTQVGPTMSAASSVRTGSVVSVTGSGIPRDRFDIVFYSKDEAAVHRSVVADANGRWVYRYTATKTYQVTGQSYADQLFAPPVTVTVS